jgi:beta-phosphoglucomutase
MTDRAIRAVIFDVDGVLCESEPFITEAAIAVLRDHYGVHAAPEEFRPFTGTGEARFITGVAEQHGLQLDPDVAKAQIYEIYPAIIRGRLKATPGVKLFVAACRAAGLRLAVASSADRVKVDANLDEIGLPADRFDALVSGTDVMRQKPDPDVFELAAQRLGVAPARSLVIEDATNGIVAAKRAGMRAMGVTSTFAAAELVEAGADDIASDFTDVPATLCAELGIAPFGATT